MEFSFNQVKGLLDEVRPFLIRGGVNEKKCAMPTGEINEIKLAKYNEVFDFLHQLILGDEWQEVQKVWKLLSPEVWAGYELHEFEDLAEQILLKNACEKLKAAWRKKPSGFFGKHIEPPDPNADLPPEDCSDIIVEG